MCKRPARSLAYGSARGGVGNRDRPPPLFRCRRSFPQRFDFVPQLSPFLPFGIGKFDEGVAADGGEIVVLLPRIGMCADAQVISAEPSASSWPGSIRSQRSNAVNVPAPARPL